MKDRDFFVSKERNRGRAVLAIVLVALLVFCSLDVTRAETVSSAVSYHAASTAGNMPFWVASLVMLLFLLVFMTLIGRNFGLFPYPTRERMNGVIRKLCNVGSRHGKLRYLMFVLIISYVFLMSLYKYIFFSEAARITYAKA